MFSSLFVALVLAHLVNRIYTYRLTQLNLDSFGICIIGLIVSLHIDEGPAFHAGVSLLPALSLTFLWGYLQNRKSNSWRDW